MGIPSLLWPLGLVLGAFAVVRCTRDVVLWMAWGGLFLAYELRLGTNLDRGLYAIYVAIPLTAILGIGIGTVARPGSLRRGATAGGPSAFAPAFRRTAAVAALLLFFVPETVASWRAGSQKPPGTEFLSSALVQTCLWIRDHTPPETVVVQPPGLINVNLVPCYARRRPILLQARRHHLFVGTRGSPLNLRSFRALDRGVLAELTRDGTAVYSFVADPFEARDPAPGGTDALFHWIPVEASITVGSVPHTTTLWRLAPGTGNPSAGAPESG
jgi:hypothetical protein